MNVPLRAVVPILSVFVILMPAPGTTDIIVDAFCPPLQRLECKRGVKWPYSTDYAKLYSHTYDATFLCDTKTDGGGWIVIQRRVNNSTKFNQLWTLYKDGFGEVCSDYWLGNKYIYDITHSGKYELRIDMLYGSKQYYAYYKEFYINGEDSNYTLHASGFKGNTKDELANHNLMQFSTPDRDNDASSQRNCARLFESGWWYKDCISTNLNGQFKSKIFGRGVIWRSITSDRGSLDAVEMKIRRRSRST
ncbi:Ficolin-1 [Bulinus truncatus]|nr:Ficolin-1 [Bulinus truncatus]